jgi:hypothetical protein
MPLPPAVRDQAVREVEQFCERKIPEDVRSKVRLEHTIRGNSITIVERRAPWSEHVGPEWTSLPVAQLRYDDGLWTLHAADRNGRWFLYDDVRPAPGVGPLLTEIDDDPTGIFWG